MILVTSHVPYVVAMVRASVLFCQKYHHTMSSSMHASDSALFTTLMSHDDLNGTITFNFKSMPGCTLTECSAHN